MKIFLSEYETSWEEEFRAVKNIISRSLPGFQLSIEHIGSTALKGIKAKPVIDIQVGIGQTENLDDSIELLVNNGFEYIEKYTTLIPGRRFYTYLIEPNRRKVNVHLVQIDSDWFIRHLAFRDYLLENESLKFEYEKLKIRLAEKEWEDVNDYAGEKTKWIRGIEEKAVPWYLEKGE